MKWTGLAVCLAMTLVGCGNPQAEQMSTGEATVEWDGLTNFESGPMLEIGYPAEMGDWKSVKQAASSDEFAASVSALEQSNPPADKQEALTAAIADLRALIQAAKEGSNEDLKAAHEKVNQSIGALRG